MIVLIALLVSFVYGQEPCLQIEVVQGDKHKSPFEGQQVCVKGIVTHKYKQGFYIQTPDDYADDDDKTSNGLLIFLDEEPDVKIGNTVQVTGTISEYIPGGPETANLPITEIAFPSDIKVKKIEEVFPGSNKKIEPIIIGEGGRIPPTKIIYPNELNVYECNGDGLVNINIDLDAYDFYGPMSEQQLLCPELNLDYGLDFYEAIEGMLVTFQDPTVVGPTNRFGETYLVTNLGLNATGMNEFGGITIDPFVDFNPERVQIQDESIQANLGATFSEGVTGVIAYEYGNFKMFPTKKVEVENNKPNPAKFKSEGLKIATYNILNFHTQSSKKQVDKLAKHIVNNLDSPDIIALQEVQDNSGPKDNKIVKADKTLKRLIRGISNKGGPKYNMVNINPVNNMDGGQPGGNIRNAYLYNPKTVELAESQGQGTKNVSGVVVEGKMGPEFNFNPVLVDPMNDAFVDSRKPLAAHFVYLDTKESIYLINVHFSSKYGSQPLFGAIQPAKNGGESARAAQANIVNEFALKILELDEDALVAILGDLNEFTPFPTSDFPEWYGPDSNFTDILFQSDDSWTYIYQGNCQALDHVFVSVNLEDRIIAADVIHTNNLFNENQQASDHDPIVFSFM